MMIKRSRRPLCFLFGHRYQWTMAYEMATSPTRWRPIEMYVCRRCNGGFNRYPGEAPPDNVWPTNFGTDGLGWKFKTRGVLLAPLYFLRCQLMGHEEELDILTMGDTATCKNCREVRTIRSLDQYVQSGAR